MNLQLRVQGTPNPLARKYILGSTLKAQGRVSYKDPHSCAHIALARALFALPGVRQLHFFQNTLTLSQDGSLAWESLEEQLRCILEDLLESHDPHFPQEAPGSQATKEKVLEDPALRAIDAILEEHIRPSLRLDGGDVELEALEGSVLTLRYMGACGGCPSAMTGTLEAIRSILQREYHPKLQVVAL